MGEAQTQKKEKKRPSQKSSSLGENPDTPGYD